MKKRNEKIHMIIQIVEKTERKREIMENCHSAFSGSLLARKNFEEIFSRIDQHAVFFAASEGADIVGYAAVYANDKITKAGYITVISVTEEVQGKHVGSALLNRCIDQAAENGMTCVRLEVFKSNINAIRFYEHSGFAYEKDCSEESIYLVKQL